MESAVADLGGDEALGCVELDAEVSAEWGGVDRIVGIVRSHGKGSRQSVAVHRFDRDDVIGPAEMQIDGRRFAEHLIAFFVQLNHVPLVERNVNTQLRRLCRPAEEFFKFSI